MKRILSLILVLSLALCVFPLTLSAAVSADDDAPAGKNRFAQQTVSINFVQAFEENFAGYEPSSGSFEGRSVRILSRNGEDETSTRFNYYRWGTLNDINEKYIPLSTANYLVLNYYYYSPDESPALVGNRMQYAQGRIVPADNISQIVEYGWGKNVYSRNGMVANQWDTLVFPLASEDSPLGEVKAQYSDAEYYLAQMKLFPLERDMGKNDILYVSDLVYQSWDPDEDAGFADRTVRFFNDPIDASDPEKAIASMTVKDIETFTIPEYTGNPGENREFFTWECTFDGKTYRPGDEMQLLAGTDISFVPVFNYTFDFSAFDQRYINGYPDNTFRPQNNVTRAEAAQIIASIIDPDGKLASEGRISFGDVKADDWFAGAVAALERVGALEIFGEAFEADRPITRAELVEVLYVISDRDYESIRLSYVPDISPEDRWYDAVMYAVSTGIITGYEDGSFGPNNNITRAETVTIINRLIGRTANGSGETGFTDIADHWAKDQIVISSADKDAGVWESVVKNKEYELKGSTTQEYIDALREQAAGFSGDAIRRGIDVIAEQMKKDILSTPNTADIYGDQMTARTYYVSEKHGDDANDGLTPETAVKTPKALENKMRLTGKGTSVLFERGGIYRGSVAVRSGFIYGSYGEGDKPILTVSQKDYADPALWKETDCANIYELTDKITNVGVITFDHDHAEHGNYDALYGKCRIFGANIKTYAELTKDLEFFSCADTLYLYSAEGNPGSRFHSIEIGNKVDVLDGAGSNIIFDNLHIKNTGAHGIGLGSSKNITVTNCEFSWLGGSLLGNYGETTTQYGNAVEIYGNCDGYYVRNNWMYQIYDTAVTHQGNDGVMNDIDYSGNLMEYVHWGIECWVTPEKGTPSLTNYHASYNLLRNGGRGWGSIVNNRMSAARLYSFSTVNAENSNLKCEHNIIDRCAGYLLDIDKRSSEEFDGNIYVQEEGKTLGGLKSMSKVCTATAAQDIHDYLGDQNAIVVFIPMK